MQIDWGLVAVILIAVGASLGVLVLFKVVFKRKEMSKEAMSSRFLGTQMDFAILVAGLVLFLLVIIPFVVRLFSGS